MEQNPTNLFLPMIELKVQCDCGQKFKFDVEPVNGRMPFTVNCPLCGADGTNKANALLQQVPPAPASQAVPAAPAPIAPPPVPPGLKIETSAPAPPRPAPAAAAARPGTPVVRPQPQKGNDGWAKSESDFNKLGQWVLLIPTIICAMLAGGFIPIEVSPTILAAIVGVCGLAGGAINIQGRGPIWVGMIVGLVIALGGFGAVAWWVHDRESVRKFEIAIAFIIGAAPGFGLQFLFQKLLLKRKQ